MKKHQSKHSKGVCSISILSVVILFIMCFVGEPHLYASQDAAQGDAKGIQDTSSSGPGLASGNNSIDRNSSVMIEGQPFPVSQKGQKCVIQGMTPSSQSVPVTGRVFAFLFTVCPNDCSWTASATSAFLHTSNPSGTGIQTVEFSVDPNTTLKKESGKITMLIPASGKKKNFTVKQSAK